MPKRHRDALSAQAGACNTLALAHSLVAAIKEAREQYSGDFARADACPAVRLITHQLSYLLGTQAFDIGSHNSSQLYVEALEACERGSMADHERARAVG